MNRNIILCFLLIPFIFQTCKPNREDAQMKKQVFALAIHGGAGEIGKMKLSEDEQKAYHKALNEALHAGYEILKTGGSSIDAVEKAIMVMEDSPLFNAGKGAVFTHDGTIELDAAIMNGRTLDAGALAGVKHIKNPISAARLIMTKSKSVFLYGEGAENFVREKGVKLVDTSYFFTQSRWEQLQDALKKDDGMQLDHGEEDDKEKEGKYGTVGCVALDQAGNLAAGTSTGGLVNKKFNRIGDSPLIGAGTYAENGVCAVSCTGRGEDFIKNVIAYDIACRIKYRQHTLTEAVGESIQVKLKANKGRGGCVAMDALGNIVFNFTTGGMFRGSVDTQGNFKTAIFR
jgi:beta-aspartyl-peptidase (threonine type)